MARRNPAASPAPKLCAACGRPMEASGGRRGSTTYCSRRCQRQRVGPLDRRFEAGILELLSARSCGATICPSEVARRARPDDWRDWMEAVRRAGRRLAADGRVEFTQGGRVVDASTARGPVRLRLGDAGRPPSGT